MCHCTDDGNGSANHSARRHGPPVEVTGGPTFSVWFLQKPAHTGKRISKRTATKQGVSIGSFQRFPAIRSESLINQSSRAGDRTCLQIDARASGARAGV